jgi:hypothetical protein
LGDGRERADHRALDEVTTERGEHMFGAQRLALTCRVPWTRTAPLLAMTCVEPGISPDDCPGPLDGVSAETT